MVQEFSRISIQGGNSRWHLSPHPRGVANALHTLQLEGAPRARGSQEQQGKKILGVIK